MFRWPIYNGNPSLQGFTEKQPVDIQGVQQVKLRRFFPNILGSSTKPNSSSSVA